MRIFKNAGLVEIAKSYILLVHIYYDNYYKYVRKFSLIFSLNSCLVWLLFLPF
jgi:hypothetical protein